MKGKIGRLPRHIREELNYRLDQGETGPALADWLNSLPETQKVLAASFEGRAINEQNLSDWRQGEFQEWLAREEIFERVDDVREDAIRLWVEPGERTVADDVATVVSARYAALLANWNGDMNDEFRQKMRGLRRLCQDVTKLKRAEAVAGRLRLDMDKLREEKATKMDRFMRLFAPMVRGSKEGTAAYEVLRKICKEGPGAVAATENKSAEAATGDANQG